MYIYIYYTKIKYQNPLLFDLVMACTKSALSVSTSWPYARARASLAGARARYRPGIPPPDLDPNSVPYTLLGVGGNIERRDSRTRKVTDEVVSRRSPGVPKPMHYFSGRNLDEISLVRLFGCTSRLAAVSVQDSPLPSSNSWRSETFHCQNVVLGTS